MGPVVEDNEFSFAGDDCMNIHNYLSVVVRRDDADPRRVLLLDGVGEADMTGRRGILTRGMCWLYTVATTKHVYSLLMYIAIVISLCF